MILEMSLELCGSKGDISLLMVDLEEAQVEPGDRGSANLNGSFNVAPRSSKVLQGCPRLFIVCIAPRFSEQFIFLQGLGALESS
jgi:hypothetical protein